MLMPQTGQSEKAEKVFAVVLTCGVRDEKDDQQVPNGKSVSTRRNLFQRLFTDRGKLTKRVYLTSTSLAALLTEFRGLMETLHALN